MRYPPIISPVKSETPAPRCLPPGRPSPLQPTELGASSRGVKENLEPNLWHSSQIRKVIGGLANARTSSAPHELVAPHIAPLSFHLASGSSV